MKTVKCWSCLKQIEIKNDTYYHGIKNRPGDPRFYCKDCYKKLKSKRMKKYSWNNLSDEDKEKRIQLSKKYWDNLSKEYKELRIKQQSDRMKEIWNNLSDEDKEKRREFLRNIYNNLSDDQKLAISIQAKSRYASMSEDQLHQIGENIKKWYNNLSEQEKIEYALSKKEWYNNLSDEDKAEWSIRQINFWKNMSDEERKEFMKKQSDGWNSLSDEKKIIYLKNKIINSTGNNKFHKKFENSFMNSYLIYDYYIQPEEVLSDKTTHSWDYGIYSKNTNQLVMVIDLDGDYYHANKCDYDGIHSKEEYDEKRSLSVPDGIKYYIIQENQFSKCFNELIKIILLDYNSYIKNIFNYCRSMPFPSPKYNISELLQSWNDLCKMKCDDKYYQNISINTRIGDRLIQHFHESIYMANRIGKPSPYDAWHNDELLLKCIKNRVIYQSHLNPNKILQGFNVSKIAPKVSVFSAGRAKLLINKYLSEYNCIFDPFSGFSGRMLGAISLGKQYIGQDISIIHINESKNIIEFLHNYFQNINANVFQNNILSSSGEYECLFTCPPYSDKEQWQDVPIDKRNCDDWIDECLSRFKCKKYLFVVDETVKYHNYIVDVITNKSHLNTNNEYIIMINGEG